jgi:hypothetical protein
MTAETKFEGVFSITAGKGFQIKFANGVMASVQFGPGNYCSRKHTGWREPAKVALTGEAWESPDAEVAFFWTEVVPGAWCTREVFRIARDEEINDDVYGHVSPNELLPLLLAAAALQRPILTSQPGAEA